jgi:hypothetical protein
LFVVCIAFNGKALNIEVKALCFEFKPVTQPAGGGEYYELKRADDIRR